MPAYTPSGRFLTPWNAAGTKRWALGWDAINFNGATVTCDIDDVFILECERNHLTLDRFSIYYAGNVGKVCSYILAIISNSLGMPYYPGFTTDANPFVKIYETCQPVDLNNLAYQGKTLLTFVFSGVPVATDDLYVCAWGTVAAETATPLGLQPVSVERYKWPLERIK